jgi:hypothetical protein
VDPNWIRWIVSSLNKHFNDALTAAGLPLFVEGPDRRTDKLQDYAEFRYSGPRFLELSKGYWQVDVDIDILVVSKTNDINIYTPEVGVGNVLAAFTNDVAVFQFGTGPGDDPNAQLGCLRLVPPNGGLTVNNFGYPREQVRLRQASVEATYRMNLST